MRQITPNHYTIAMGKLSKLPMRQITFRCRQNSGHVISKLPMRQITVLLYSITRTTAVLTPILPNLTKKF